MEVKNRIELFIEKYRKLIIINGVKWSYYKLGNKKEYVTFLSGGLKKAKIGFETLENLSENYTIIAPDYPPVRTVDEILDGIEIILKREGIKTTVIIGQSYGGIIAQALYWFKPDYIKSLIITSSGPTIFTTVQFAILHLILVLIRILPEKIVKKLFFSNIIKVLTFKEIEKNEYIQLVKGIVNNEISKEDVYSFFLTILSFGKKLKNADISVAQDIPIRVLKSEDDHTQDPKDDKRFKSLYNNIEIINIGKFSHTAYLKNPKYFADKVSEVLAIKNCG